MRKTILLAVAVLTLAVVVVGSPATAAPKALTWTITCPDRDQFTVTAKGTPGFPTGGGTPVLLLGGSFLVTDLSGNVIDSWETLPPPGLEPMMEVCVVEGPVEAADFHLVVDPAYLFFTG